eukprot:1140641-Pelagomonas_calceolata.AAC.5
MVFAGIVAKSYSPGSHPPVTSTPTLTHPCMPTTDHTTRSHSFYRLHVPTKIHESYRLHLLPAPGHQRPVPQCQVHAPTLVSEHTLCHGGDAAQHGALARQLATSLGLSCCSAAPAGCGPDVGLGRVKKLGEEGAQANVDALKSGSSCKWRLPQWIAELGSGSFVAHTQGAVNLSAGVSKGEEVGYRRYCGMLRIALQIGRAVHRSVGGHRRCCGILRRTVLRTKYCLIARLARLCCKEDGQCANVRARGGLGRCADCRVQQHGRAVICDSHSVRLQLRAGGWDQAWA